MFLWMISGEAANDSGGGEMFVYAITEDSARPPDPHAALTEAAPRYSWYRVDEIVLVGEARWAWDDSANSNVRDILISHRVKPTPDLPAVRFVTSATPGSTEETSRRARLFSVLRSVKRRLPQAVGLKIAVLQDHKGFLGVTWKSPPSDLEKEAFAQAWEENDEPGDNVGHSVLPD